MQSWEKEGEKAAHLDEHVTLAVLDDVTAVRVGARHHDVRAAVKVVRRKVEIEPLQRDFAPD